MSAGAPEGATPSVAVRLALLPVAASLQEHVEAAEGYAGLVLTMPDIKSGSKDARMAAFCWDHEMRVALLHATDRQTLATERIASTLSRLEIVLGNRERRNIRSTARSAAWDMLKASLGLEARPDLKADIAAVLRSCATAAGDEQVFE